MQYKTGAEGLITRLQEATKRVLGQVIPDGPVALVDYPGHSNVGDSAIWLGETLYLRRERGISPSYCCTIPSYSAASLAEDAPTGAILIHGGGNFGTLWPHHQEFRNELLERFPGRPIVQLPQSIHFSDDSAVAATARAISRHKAFTLLVRDQKSYEFATARFDCAVHLCPDMAFYIGRTARRSPEVKFMFLIRTDGERTGDRFVPETRETRLAADWLGDSRNRLRFARRVARVQNAFAGRAHRRAAEYDAVAWNRFHRGVKLLSRGEVVITDRLHAHILSLLLDIPHVTLDNSYGKLGSFIEAWTASYMHLHRATTMAEAVQQARRSLGPRPMQD
jgi:exopolysaccharide biosynthesis predicted pyruvyltransferase EpsI